MEPFFGRILLVKRAPMLPAEYTKTAGIFATIERNDKTIDYLMFWFTAEEGEWRYRFVERSEYRASSHIEFRPEKGDAAVILRTHLVPSATLAPVPGTDGQFDIQADDYDPESAAETANKNVAQLQNSLKKVGLDAVFKIIAPAKKPEKPWLAEDAPALENKKP